MAGGSVGLTEVIAYGFRLMGMMILIGLVAAVFIVPGAILSGSGLIGAAEGEAADGALAVVGVILMVIGFLVYLAGFMGLQFKVISEGVSRGIPRPRQPANAPRDQRPAPQPGPHATPGQRA